MSRFFVAALALWLALSGCSSESQHEPSNTTALPGGVVLQAPVRVIGALLPAAKGARVDLGSDWFPAGGNGVALVKGTDADLLLAATGEERELAMVVEGPAFLGAGQTLNVKLNGTDLGTQSLALGSNELRYQLPADAVRFGVNRVELSAAKHGRPKDAGVGSSDTRDYSVGLKFLGVGPAQFDVDSARTRAEELLRESRPAHLVGGTATWASLFFPPSAEMRVAGSAKGPGQVDLVLATDKGAAPLWRKSLELSGGAWESASAPLDVTRETATFAIMVPTAGSELELERCQVVADRDWPNLLVISVDTLRADRIFDPESKLNIPTIRGLIEEGVAFEDTFSHTPMTLPSHTALFSSRLPYETGVRQNGQLVPNDFPLLAEWMRAAGYETRSATSIGTLWTPQPGAGLDRGFGIYEDDVLDILPGDQVLTRDLEVIDGLEQHQPFFLFLHFSDPHIPYNSHGTASTMLGMTLDGEPFEELEISDMKSWEKTVTLPPGEHELVMTCPQLFVVRRLVAQAGQERYDVTYSQGERFRPLRELRAEFEVPEGESREVTLSSWLSDNPGIPEVRRRYGLEIEYTDKMLGLALDDLRKRGLLENTLIVFTSDHGEAFGEHGHVGHVEQVFDESLHVPLVIVPPKGSPAAPLLEAQSDALVRLVDVVPTILDMLGLSPLEGSMGRSLLEEGPRVHYAEAKPGPGFESVYALRDQHYLLIYHADEERFQMFDVVSDPEQKVDVFKEHGSERAEWQELLRDIASGKVGSMADSVGGEEMLDRLGGLGYL